MSYLFSVLLLDLLTYFLLVNAPETGSLAKSAQVLIVEARIQPNTKMLTTVIIMYFSSSKTLK